MAVIIDLYNLGKPAAFLQNVSLVVFVAMVFLHENVIMNSADNGDVHSVAVYDTVWFCCFVINNIYHLFNQSQKQHLLILMTLWV